jgi:hypothetical protein
MPIFIILAQIAVAVSVYFVWIFRYEAIILEFSKFGLTKLSRTFTGAVKISLSTLLIVSIWHTSMTQITAILMGSFMLAAQYFHFKVKNPFIKHLPSLILLILNIIIAINS